MSDFGTGTWRKSRKLRRCEQCLGPIPVGELHYYYSGMYDGAWQNWRAHRECTAAYEADGCEEFMPGDFPIPDRIKELDNHPLTAHNTK